MTLFFKTVAITGASSGIGQGLALFYARPDAVLFLTGRNPERLGETVRLCLEKGASIHGAVLDVTDASAVKRWITESFASSPFDLLVANAGISAGTLGGEEGEEQTRQIFDTNLTGVLNTVLPVLPLMKERKDGHIALISSLAGYRGMPSAPAYCASKAAVKVWGEALSPLLKPAGVKLSVVCPGFVDSGITRKNTFHMPFLMTPEESAKRIDAGLRKNRARIAYPFLLSFTAWLVSCLSPRISDFFLTRLPEKTSANGKSTGEN